MDDKELLTLVVDDTQYVTTHTAKFSRRKAFTRSDPKRVVAHIPGVIRKVWVRPGQDVRWGDRLLVLEAMKMRNDVLAPVAGRIKAIHVIEGEMAAKGQLLVELE